MAEAFILSALDVVKNRRSFLFFILYGSFEYLDFGKVEESVPSIRKLTHCIPPKARSETIKEGKVSSRNKKRPKVFSEL